MFIGWLLRMFTFPGAIVHDLVHFLVCRTCGVPMTDRRVFRAARFDEEADQSRIDDYSSAAAVAVIPFAVMSGLCPMLCVPMARVISGVGGTGLFQALVMAWVGVSIGAHAIPSGAIAKSLWSTSWSAIREWNPLTLVTVPLSMAMYVVDMTSIFVLHIGWGLFLGLYLPSMWS